MESKLEQCPVCGTPTCYTQLLGDGKFTKMCLRCGFTTTSEMKKGSKAINNVLETSPELYRDLIYTDDQGYCWTPATIIVPEVGMVFVDGTSKDNWKWGAVKAIKRPRAERRRNPDKPKYRMDSGNIKHFEPTEFSDACNHVKLFLDRKK